MEEQKKPIQDNTDREYEQLRDRARVEADKVVYSETGKKFLRDTYKQYIPEERSNSEEDWERKEYEARERLVDSIISRDIEKIRHPVRTRIREYLSELDLDCFMYVTSLKEFGGGPYPGDDTPNIDFIIDDMDESIENNRLFNVYQAMPILLKAAMAYAFWLWYQVILGMPNESLCVDRFRTVRKTAVK